MKSSVTVIMPYYKKRRFVLSSFKSFANQEFKDKNLIIIYDDKDKKDLIYLKKITKNYKNVRILVNEKNLGAGESRNRALKISRSDYIAFLDSDDLWRSGKLKEQINFMQKKNINISHTSYKIIDRKGKITGYRKAAAKLNYGNLIKSCDIGLSTVIIKRSFLKSSKFSNLKTKEDYVLWLKLSKKDNFYGLDKPYTEWRNLDNSLSSSTFQKISDAFKVYYFYEKFSMIKSTLMVLRLSFFYFIKTINKNYDN
jgi:teichuronic acid biosynthesis glycosyltransferase TuaG